MTATGLLFAFLVIAAVAMVVSGSVWVATVIAVLELGFWALTRYVKQSRNLGH